MKKTLMLCAAVALLTGAAPRPRAEPSPAGGFVVVVNVANTTTILPRSVVAKIFLRRAGWPSGAPATPVDQVDRSPARVEFTKVVHGKSVSAIKAFWQQKIFSGQDVPPLEKSTDAEVLAFVRATPTAIGYVAPSTPLPSGVRELAISAD